MTIPMDGNLWRVKNPDKFEDWVAAVELAANQFKSKTGQAPTHINVLEPTIAEQLAEIYDEQGYKFVLGSRLPNEVLVGVPQNERDAGVDQLRRHKEYQQLEDAQEDKPQFEYDNESATVTFGNIKLHDVEPEDVLRLAKDASVLDELMELYDWTESKAGVSA